MKTAIRHIRTTPGPASLAVALLLTALLPCSASTAAAADSTLKINFSKDTIQPTPAQSAAIRLAAADDIRDFIHPDQGGYAVALADLDDDGRPDLLVQYSDISFCGSSGCSGAIVMATPDGYARDKIDLPNFYGEITVLPAMHHGMHDLRYDNDSPVWSWNGKAYDVARADLPGANAPAWATRDAGDRKVALAVPIDSAIKSLSLFCNEGKPVLAMLLKEPRAAEATTLTWVFNGWTVNVPMSPANRDGTLWMTYLSGSQLLQWLAPRPQCHHQ